MLDALDSWRTLREAALALAGTDRERELVSLAYDYGAMDARDDVTRNVIDRFVLVERASGSFDPALVDPDA